jgi:hypothetical protein
MRMKICFEYLHASKDSLVYMTYIKFERNIITQIILSVAFLYFHRSAIFIYSRLYHVTVSFTKLFGNTVYMHALILKAFMSLSFYGPG